MNSSAGQRAAGHLAARVSGLFLRHTRYRHAIEQELVALASLVLAAASSAKAILAKVPDGAERQHLLLACEQLARAAGDVVDPRSDFQHLSESGVEDAIHAFVGHHEQCAWVRSAALEMARKRESSSRARRKPNRDHGAPGAQCFAIATRPGRSHSWMLTMPPRSRARSAPLAAWSLGSLWHYVARTLERRIRTRDGGT